MSRPVRTVTIDSFASSIGRYARHSAIVAVDVLRATTTAVTAAASGRRCLPARSLEHATELVAALDRPLVAGELSGHLLEGFELGNSPAALAQRADTWRPLVLLTTSGTPLICEAAATAPTYVASLRNWSATVDHLAGRHDRVVVIGAGSRGEFREEDQLGCAWIAAGLLAAGYLAEDAVTSEVVDRWAGRPVEAALSGNSTRFLEGAGHREDVDFVAAHVDDVSAAFVMARGEVTEVTAAAGGRP